MWVTFSNGRAEGELWHFCASRAEGNKDATIAVGHAVGLCERA